MSDFNPDEYLAKKEAFDPDAYLAQKDAVTDKPAEYSDNPSALKQFYERNVVGPVMGAVNLVPGGKALEHMVTDPIAGYFKGISPDENQARREAYQTYFRKQYPGVLEGSEFGADMVASPYKGAYIAAEPFINQTVTHPERVGFNPETALNVAPLALQTGLGAPAIAAKSIAGVKLKKPEYKSFEAYRENPKLYDDFEAKTGGEPVKHMSGNMIDTLSEKERSIAEALEAAKDAKSSATLGEQFAKRDIGQQRASAYVDKKNELALGLEDSNAAKSVVSDLKDANRKVGEIRDEVLNQSNTTFHVDEIDAILSRAEKSVLGQSERSKIRSAREELQTLVDNSNEYTLDMTPINQRQQFISPQQLTKFRGFLQDNVTYGYGMSPADRALNGAAREINATMDAKIPEAHELRNVLHQQTKDFNTALDLFGGEYNLGSLKSALKDPVKRAAVERIADANNITSLKDTIRKFDDWEIIKEQKARKEYIPVPAEQDLIYSEKAKKDAIRALLEQKFKKDELPFSSVNAEGKLQANLIANPMHPKELPTRQLQDYGQNVHPGGPDDFLDQYNKTKVLRDLSTADVAQGSRSAVVGATTGSAVGSAIGYGVGGPLGSGVGGAIGSGIGGYLGAKADISGSNAIRGLTKMGQKPFVQTMSKFNQSALSPTIKAFNNPEYLRSKVQGTPYQQQFTGDEQKDAITHYMLSQKDPEYQNLIMGDYNR